MGSWGEEEGGVSKGVRFKIPHLFMTVAVSFVVMAQRAIRYTTAKMRLRIADAAGKTQITHLQI